MLFYFYVETADVRTLSSPNIPLGEFVFAGGNSIFRTPGHRCAPDLGSFCIVSEFHKLAPASTMLPVVTWFFRTRAFDLNRLILLQNYTP